MDFAIIPAHQGEAFFEPLTSTQLTYRVIDLTNSLERTYQLQIGVGAPPAAGPFQGWFARFRPRTPTTVSGFEGIGVYLTSETANPGFHSGTSIRSALNLFAPAGGAGSRSR